MNDVSDIKISRRQVLKAGAASAGAAVVPSLGLAQAPLQSSGAPVLAAVSFTVNGQPQHVSSGTALL